MTIEPDEPNTSNQQKKKFNLAVGALVAAFIGLFGIFSPWLTAGGISISGNRSNEAIFPFAVVVCLVLFGLSNLLNQLSHFEKATQILILISSLWSISSYYEWHQKVMGATNGSTSSLNKSLNDLSTVLGKDFLQTLQNITIAYKPTFGIGFFISLFVAIVTTFIGLAHFLYGGKIWRKKIIVDKTKIPEMVQTPEKTAELGDFRRIRNKYVIGTISFLLIGGAIIYSLSQNKNSDNSLLQKNEVQPTTATPSESHTPKQSVNPVTSIPADFLSISPNFYMKWNSNPTGCNKHKNVCFAFQAIGKISCSKGYSFSLQLFTPTEKTSFGAINFFTENTPLSAMSIHTFSGVIDLKSVQIFDTSVNPSKYWDTDYIKYVQNITCTK